MADQTYSVKKEHVLQGDGLTESEWNTLQTSIRENKEALILMGKQ